MLLKLKSRLTYGPVQSRRLGPSLGINILPSKVKVCTFNCLYCQYGWTDFEKLNFTEINTWPSVDEVALELERVFRSIFHPPSYITFSGNGEPTLHPDFPEIVDRVSHLRDKYLPHTKTAILSNSSMVNDASIRIALSQLDVRIMKLDAGNKKIFSQFNQPETDIKFEEIVEGLASLEKVILQTLFTSGPLGNFHKTNLSDWIKVVKKINPVNVQIYSLDRGSPSANILEVDKKNLDSIVSRLRAEHIISEAF
jgi:wyosine [tRNA(Phe)-imidazoG37] synthetase (radical SAM superfamily)